jgi:signal transduction histidine kinase
MIPYRELYFTIEHNNTSQTIVLRHLLPGEDDIAEGTLLIILGLMLLISLLVFVILNVMAGKIWKPFYQTLDRLTAFKISGPLPAFPDTKIDEFRLLNTTLDNLLKKAAADYRHNKEFGENASHELQTHLAIIRANTEKLINENRDGEIPGELQKIYSAATTLSQIQKSLLLLGKIGNQEFSNLVKTDLKTTVEQSIETFREAIEIREIKVTTALGDCVVTTDPGLAGILVNNLLKNAVKYNIQGGYIQIGLNKNELKISNSGQPFAGNPETMMKRFEKGKEGNVGIGLAIVKQICGLYNYGVSYKVSEEAVHTVKVVFNS